MTAKRWITAAILAAVATVSLPAAGAAQPSPAVEVTAAEAALRDLQQQEQTLNDSTATPVQREEAARRLVSRSTRESREVMARVLGDARNRDAQVAVAKAMASDPNPDPALIDVLYNLMGSDRALTEAAAQALAAYKNNPAARARLVGFVTNVSQVQGPRLAAIRAMARLIDKQAAAVLVDLMNTDSSPVVRDTAADALVEMTGIAKNARDAQRWNEWWRANQPRGDAEWANELLNRNAARAGDMEKRLAALRDNTARIVKDEYRKAADADKPKVIEGYLGSEAEDLRLIAVRIVFDDFANGKTVAPQIFETLRRMVGDSSTDVRQDVARTLGAANDAGAIDALLTQLTQERDPDVRVALVAALGPAHDIRAVEPLLARLGDESFAVARAAADALRDLAPTLREQKNSTLARQVADALLRRLRDTGQNIAAANLRVSIVDAMSKLGHASFIAEFQGLLNPDREPARVRESALAGLGLIGSSDAGNAILTSLRNDPERVVRLAAATALGKTAVFTHVQQMALAEGEERDAEVRKAIWTSISQLLEAGDERELARLAEQFKRTAEYRAAVQAVIEKKQVARNATQDLALTRQNLGETLMRLNKPAEAAEKFKASLDYWNSASAKESVTDPIMQQYMEALLRARNFDQAVRFATDTISANKATSPTLWAKFKAEADHLRDAKDVDGALSLIEGAKKVPFGESYARWLETIESDLRRVKSTGGEMWVPGWGAEWAASLAMVPTA